MITRYFLLLCLVTIFVGCSSQKKTAGSTAGLSANEVRQILLKSADQYKFFINSVPNDRMPRSFEGGELKTTTTSGWVSGFYPGTLLRLYEYTNEKMLLQEAEKRLKILEKEQFNKNTHDLGFMMYCSFGNANRISPNDVYKTILINSARSLVTRFNPAVGCIRSWNSDDGHFLVIIDNMMNLELLMYAFRQTNDSVFYNVAITHANTTIKNHFRDDYSSYHVIDYNPLTGAIQEKRTHQGAANESAWARGQAWGLYGFTMLYRETGNKIYLNQAKHIADFILNHPNLPSDKIPYWDFNAPAISATYRDASAGAIISSALFELAGYVSTSYRKQYLDVANIILKNLSSPLYKSTSDEVGGFLIKHGVGHLPGKSEINVPLSYGDYYFVEALLRYTGKLKPVLFQTK